VDLKDRTWSCDRHDKKSGQWKFLHKEDASDYINKKIRGNTWLV
jgi:hypothetical protein